MTLFSGAWLVIYYILILSGWLAAFGFTLGFGVLTRWWKTEQGIHLFSYGLAITFAMTLISLRLVFGDFSGRAFVSMVCVFALVSVLWWRFVLFIRSYIRGRKSTKRSLGLTENGSENRTRRSGQNER